MAAQPPYSSNRGFCLEPFPPIVVLHWRLRALFSSPVVGDDRRSFFTFASTKSSLIIRTRLTPKQSMKWTGFASAAAMMESQGQRYACTTRRDCRQSNLGIHMQPACEQSHAVHAENTGYPGSHTSPVPTRREACLTCSCLLCTGCSA